MKTQEEIEKELLNWLGGHDFSTRFPWAVTLTMKQVIWEVPKQPEQASEMTALDEAVELAMKRHTKTEVAPQPIFLTREEASNSFRIFRQKLNDQLFGRHWGERGKNRNGIRVIPFLGGLNSGLALGNRDDLWWNSEDGGTRATRNIHYHCSFGPELSILHRGQVLENERSIGEVIDLLKNTHNRVPFGRGITQFKVVPIRDEGWLTYCGRQEAPTNGTNRWDNLDKDNLILG